MIWQVLEAVQLKDEVSALKDGPETWIGEGGISLSGGQKQRLAFARALLRLKPLMLFDDSLSAVDLNSEQTILSRLQNYLRIRSQEIGTPISIIWISHRRSSLKYFDSLLELKRGVLAPSLLTPPDYRPAISGAG